MIRSKKGISLALIGAVAMFCSIGGCTKKPSQEELTKLEESRSAAESAEKKLSELRQERIRLEQELQGKQSELQSQESERDVLKGKLGK